MQNDVPRTSFDAMRQELDALKVKINLLKSLGESISGEFEALYRNLGSILSKSDSTLSESESTKSSSASTSRIIESLSSNSVSTLSESDSKDSNIASSLRTNESLPSKSESLSRVNELRKLIIDSLQNKLKTYFPQPDIPGRMATILAALIEKKQLSVAQIRSITGMSRVTITRDIKIFKQLGWIKFHGSRKNGYFTLTEEGTTATGNAPDKI